MAQIYARSLHVLACVGPRIDVIEYRSPYQADGTYHWPFKADGTYKWPFKADDTYRWPSKEDIPYLPYRDDNTLFGVLALVDWGRGKAVVPDYEKDGYQLAVEVLQLYLENSKTKPVSGMAIEWPRRLWEIFEVEIQGRAIQKAKVKRYNGHTIPHYQSPLYVEFDPPHIRKPFRGVNGNTMYPTMYLNDRSGRSRDIWYGVRLLGNPDIRKTMLGSGDPSLPYLWCEGYDSRFSSRVTPPLVKIFDREMRSFAWAPADTKPNDWLLFSGASTWYKRTPAMVVVRDGDPNLGTFLIIGQASRNTGYLYGYEYEKCILASLEWRYFESNWHAEDLFFFDWNHKNRSIALAAPKPTMVETSNWLKMEVCAYKGSSFFKGPRTLSSDYQEHAVKVVSQWTGRYAAR
ncbi:unnamed protein product [Alternaria alternata]